jgi:hypothetical protein
MTDARQTPEDVERYIAAATQHGEDSEPDHEVGDLQQYLRVAFRLMTPEQRDVFAADPEVQDLLAVANG